MAETGLCTHRPSAACGVLPLPPKAPKKCLCGKICNAEGSDEDNTPTTAPQTPSSGESSDATARRTRCLGTPLPDKKSLPPSRQECDSTTAREEQLYSTHALKRSGSRSLDHSECPESQNIQITLTPAGPEENSGNGPSRSSCTAATSPKFVGASHSQVGSQKPAQISAAGSCENPVKAKEAHGGEGVCVLMDKGDHLQQLLEQYNLRRSAFEHNCSQRYDRVSETTRQRRKCNSMWNIRNGGGQNLQVPASHSRKKCQDGDTAELTSSSGEEAIFRGPEENATTREEGLSTNDGGPPRRSKGGGHRTFPYRQFHVHHFLPEPQNKVGLLTHPTPAQFNKYPKARGVWYDPHRNLVRTCWKENGKARTMGFPVNKFGLEEARTLAVEYHYYKCPTDPLPDDLLSLVPRKPPHAYGWC
ncbi:hypothetical protein, conserved [Eimeria tenella]|uniref:AP2/ERF domain-containing protein n=1 Tax=Eimeria tenella TaxID=5802 RepID=U6KLI0_EIMTE|nr:hypothetical protein, conserved [Eimeria tenella]CDJ38927.1 hypothetical protein, conserved [Eimeria tenella]|eukprot:XP_013229682.1 hypothetical protein, conserved [Eimeria tenella]